MMPWNYYYAEFYASNEWQIIELPLSSFKYSEIKSKVLISEQ